MTFYREGTLSIQTGQRSAVGTGTTFLANVKAGDTLHLGGASGVIEAVVSNTAILLAQDWTGASYLNVSGYLVSRTGPEWYSAKVLNDALVSVISRLNNGQPFKPDETVLTLAGRAQFDTRERGFLVARTGVVPWMFSIKQSSAPGDWSAEMSFVGPAGGQGLPGPQGQPGATGAASTVPGPAAWAAPAAWATSTAYTATAPRSVVTYLGEGYVCVESHTSIGSFEPAKWVKIVARGAQGDPGANGANGRTLIVEARNPTSGDGQNGDSFINNLTVTYFGPKSGGSWGSGTSLRELPPVIEINATSGTVNVSYGVSKHVVINLQANVGALNITDWPPSGVLARLTIEIRNTGNFTFAFPAGTRWSNGYAPTVTPGAGKEDLYAITTVDGGVSLRGHVIGQNYAE